MATSPHRNSDTAWLTVLVVLALISGSIGVSLIWPDRDPSPTAIERPTIDSLISVHGSPESGLNVCGRTFRHVRGAPPYYLRVTNSPMLLFAYEPFKGTKLLVICNTNDCSFREIPVGSAAFGNSIGASGTFGDVVEQSTSNRLTLLAKGFHYRERSVLDLNDGTFRVLEVESDNDPPLVLDFPTNLSPRSTNAR